MVILFCQQQRQSSKQNLAVHFVPPAEPSKVDDAPKTESDVKERIPVGAEATSVLVATIPELDRPAMAFVRLLKGISNYLHYPLGSGPHYKSTDLKIFYSI